ncbi:MAG: hypothetical protein LBP78_03980 [Acidaminococcales bacterium]|nr:hypothetical protein [Acidaminococcales bacterium]
MNEAARERYFAIYPQEYKSKYKDVSHILNRTQFNIRDKTLYTETTIYYADSTVVESFPSPFPQWYAIVPESRGELWFVTGEAIFRLRYKWNDKKGQYELIAPSQENKEDFS